MKETKARRKVAGLKGTVVGAEDCLNVAEIVDYQMEEHQVGAYQLHKRDNIKNTDVYQLVFGFEVSGIHSFASPQDLEDATHKLAAGLKSAPQGESLTLRLTTESNCDRRTRQLQKLLQRAGSPEIRYLLQKELERLQQISQKGIRQPKTLRAYCTYSPYQAKAKDDWYDKVSVQLMSIWDKCTDQVDIKAQQAFADLYGDAYANGFLDWLLYFEQQLEISVTPLSADDLWEDLWYRFNREEAPELPQRVVYTPEGIEEIYHSQAHFTGHLFKENVPDLDPRWIRNRGQFTGVLVFQEKPFGWATPQQQLQYLWKPITADDWHDCEVVTELRPANQKQALQGATDLAKGANRQANNADNKKKINRLAEKSKEAAIGTTDALLDGEVAYYVSTVFLVHRKTPRQLDMACDKLSKMFRSPAAVEREEQIAWRLWLDTFPVVMRKMLAQVPTDRRSMYFSSEVPGLAPLLRTRTPALSGYEFIAECGTPVCVDLYKQHQHMGFFATQRGGKSVTIGGILSHGLANDIPTVILDYPKGNGSSTYKYYSAFLPDAEYFDIAEESNNIFEAPDWRHLTVKEQKQRFNSFREFLEGALLLLVNSGSQDEKLTMTLRTIFGIALREFFSDPGIQARYQKAMDGGFGSEDWKETPTLRDFKAFCSKARLPDIKGNTEDNDKALGLINQRLEYWLHSSVGKAISQPSSFPTDAKMIVFALRNLGTEEDAAVLALSAYAAALRRSLEHDKSIFFIDESPILFKFDAIARLIATLTANGGKSGIRVLLSAQDVDSIGESPVGSQILQNLTMVLIGFIKPSAVASFVKYLGYPEALIRENTKFKLNASDLYSRWLIIDDAAKTKVRHYDTPERLALLANNPDEERKRDEVFAAVSDKYEALEQFTALLWESIKTGQKFYEDEEEVKPEVLPQVEKRPLLLAGNFTDDAA
ncbi:hypothetical protein C1752_14778 [Acaryochloris thomasi RCC1774]|uniref:TraD/TraG TraM recognition site domain-containing protein n=1 Tax=Acaryochloris thomasi RCC1774 TaxID=1764569 RepID=A0A2W1J6N9_9CYAN|nr:hypothetical protein [Acaryochloris thomasi]PZD70273.1 hypothetical protein C1752_14778 [Acaryochloris thomasi RCC1774]